MDNSAGSGSVHGSNARPRRIARGVRMLDELWSCVDLHADRTEQNASRVIEQIVREWCDRRAA